MSTGSSGSSSKKVEIKVFTNLDEATEKHNDQLESTHVFGGVGFDASDLMYMTQMKSERDAAENARTAQESAELSKFRMSASTQRTSTAAVTFNQPKTKKTVAPKLSTITSKRKSSAAVTSEIPTKKAAGEPVVKVCDSVVSTQDKPVEEKGVEGAIGKISSLFGYDSCDDSD